MKYLLIAIVILSVACQKEIGSLEKTPKDSIEISYAQRDVYPSLNKFVDSVVITLHRVTKIYNYTIYCGAESGGNYVWAESDARVSGRTDLNGTSIPIIVSNFKKYSTQSANIHLKVYYGPLVTSDSLVAKPYTITKIVTH